MCGIVGIIDKERVDIECLTRMTDVISHRGPDDSGIWLNPDHTLGFGHRRLAILDLSSNASQPMFDPQLNISLIFNGEIYNFAEIRNNLEKEGHVFRSNSDTEVLLKSYAHWGLDCLSHLQGMFAFALYDGTRNKVLLARDRAGKKPLYYSASGHRFVFASELKSLVQNHFFSKELDIEALNSYFALGYIPGEMAIYKDARKLPAGSWLLLNPLDMSFTVKPYWSIPPQEQPEETSTANLLSGFESLFMDAVSKRMVADVPYGALLSGGLDSSLIVAAMSRISDKPIKTFSIGFEERDHDERPYARQIADYFKTEHTEQIIRMDNLNILEELMDAFDEPFADASMVPTHYLMKMVRDEVTVALSGDGGDEVFGGYHAYSRTMFDQKTDFAFTRPLKKLAVICGSFLPDSMYGKQRLLRQTMSPEESFLDRRMAGYFRHNMRQQLFTSSILDELGEKFQAPEIRGLHCLESGDGDLLYRLTASDYKTYLADDILVKVDRASMWNSLEVRSPFLDHRIVDFSFKSVPSNMKLHGSTLKYIPKMLAKKILPQGFMIERKWGFAVPLKKWFRGDMGQKWIDRCLGDTSDFFRGDFVKRLFAEHRAGLADHSTQLFSVICFALWKERWLGK